MRHAFFSRRRPENREGTEPEYWLSYSDLMAGLLMAFALMLVVALYKEGEQDCTIGVYEATADTIGEILDTRQRVIRQLRDQFAASEEIDVDSAGTVRFAGSLLFDQASAEVSPQGRGQLTAFADDYFPLLLDDPVFRDQLRRIVVEGHTNSDGPYELNLDLSHSRSLAVMLVLLDAAGPYRGDLEDLVTANGRSFADLIRFDDGSVDKAGSRRIEIRFQMDDETIVHRVLQLGAILIDPESQCEQ